MFENFFLTLPLSVNLLLIIGSLYIITRASHSWDIVCLVTDLGRRDPIAIRLNPDHGGKFLSFQALPSARRTLNQLNWIKHLRNKEICSNRV